ncbi:MAG: DUF1330 domain-containing protein [Alphaproteobacteria bacterium]|nr:DUF1330 domain-containing protein [Alphaproteobacteria bacterium]MCZ6765221.1 DUF1330 domain-containing protein [Alphaproteobacteria bacterium]
MAAFMIGMVNVTNPDAYGEYTKAAPGVFKQFGAKIRIRGGDVTVLEGPEPPGRIVMIEFDDTDTIRKWYASPEYTEIKKLREGAADVFIYFLEGEPLGDVPDSPKPGYVMAKFTVTDQERWDIYAPRGMEFVASAGGVIVARGPINTIEGPETYQQSVVFKFPTVEDGVGFYHAQAYQDIIPLRAGAAEFQLFVLQGA